MPNGNSWPLYLPFSTRCYIYGYTNAALGQKIVATFEDNDVLTMQGQGEGNLATTPATYVKNTPSSGQHLNGFQVLIDIYKNVSGTWTQSQASGAGCSLGWTAATYLVVSEDLVDNDWNDAVLQFLWYNPPSVRNAIHRATTADVSPS